MRAGEEGGASDRRHRFFWPVRVYYEDTDAGGVVYHGRYVNFFERARTEWLRALGYAQSELRAEHGLVFVVSRLSIDYVKPARFDDLVAVEVELAAVRRVSFDMRQFVRRDEELLARADVRIACLDAARFRPMAVPEPLAGTIAGLVVA